MDFQFFRIHVARRELMLGIDLDRRRMLQTRIRYPLNSDIGQEIEVCCMRRVSPDEMC